ncbi:MAG TPA: B12-binding domain-containing radical SAM protein [Candidatus Cloacimonas sp.]|nr:B12-binding domain-containing radical SAM protein [Candidatus Cloacimonas sp.]
MKKVKFDHLLAAVEKPARYINAEINAVRAEPTAETTNFCLAFPDTYEVGFSHLGIKILYSILNKEADCICDRSYAPWPDFGELLKQEKLPLFGWESNLALRDFDVLGFTLQSELTYTNVLYMLDLAQIPLLRKERNEQDPLIIAGGPCASNPQPLSDFIDLFLIGEGEVAILEIKEVVKNNTQATRKQKLRKLAQIPGCYVPEFSQQSVNARKYMEFSSSPSLHKPQLLPWMQPVHDRFVAEIMRGCSRGCRFCHAGMFYRPVRERDPKQIVDELLDEVNRYGWEEAALTSLSSSDYTSIKPLLQELFGRLENRKTRLSLPSLRVDSLDDDITKLMNELRQTGLTIAPEAGSQRLRNIINKNISEAEIIDGVNTARKNGWRLVKLYFMIGLPGETWKDVEAIIDLVKKLIQVSQKSLKINITISPFVPKPFTPFQWAKMEAKEKLLEKALFLKSSVKRYKFVKLNYHEVDSSVLECVLGRGGQEVGKLITAAYKLGAKFDGWHECFDNHKWLQAARNSGLVLSKYQQQLNTAAKLPWEVVDLGIRREFLLSEWQKAQQEKTTADCRNAACSNCGICSAQVKPVYQTGFTPAEIKQSQPQLQNDNYYYRIFYSKLGKLRFVAHLDMLRMFQKILKTSGLPLSYSQGYNPHPRLSLGPPLPIGVESEKEYFDFSLQQRLALQEVRDQIIFPSQLKFIGIKQLQTKKERSMDYYQLERVQISHLSKLNWQQKTDQFNQADSWPFQRERKGKIQHKELKDLVNELQYDGEKLTILKKVSGASIFNVLQGIFGIERQATHSFRIVRKELLRQADESS